ncbi:MAG: VCBS repeat-containing protein [Planctomycetaceae bacterium]|nr:VCBS repeat-containing protein [Planctomycetaceae bacterium]
MRSVATLLILSIVAAPATGQDTTSRLSRVKYNNPGLVVDLGVGLWAWPMPMDFDGDGDMDLVVNCPDKPSNGVYVFENPTGEAFPVFKAGRRISKGMQNVAVSYGDDGIDVLSPAMSYPQFLKTGLEQGEKIALPGNIHPNKVRQNVWKRLDYDGDGTRDLIVGVGDWTEYGWDDAFDSQGKWTRGPLHGHVYWLRGLKDGKFGEKEFVLADGKPVDVFGWPSPNFADFDGDGDLDLLCGEFLDSFTYFENIGSRTAPRYAAGRKLMSQGQPLTMDLEMIVPVVIDWDRDGDLDLIVGDEDGRVAWIEGTGKFVDGLPEFLPPRYFQQEADELKSGALATPVGVDWDNDGDTDLVSGNTAGYVEFFENLSGPGVEMPKFARPVRLQAGGETLRIMAGPNGSIQGPCEAKWGYTTLSAADWDGDGLTDLIVNSIWGKVVWYRNIGSKTKPELAAARMVEVDWPAGPPKPEWTWWTPEPTELATEWRTTPVAVDWTRDGKTDLVMLDHEGYLVLFEQKDQRDGNPILSPGQRVFTNEKGEPLRLNPNRAGKSGRRKLTVVDWDGDGKLDILLNSSNANFLQQVGEKDGTWQFQDRGPVDSRNLEAHDVSPTAVDWNGDKVPDLVMGAEDGRFYYLRNSRSQ